MEKKMMSDYTLFCTEEQTRKALELGAPIISYHNACTTDDIPHFTIAEGNGNCTLYIIPTAEQMCGWLEEQGMFIEVDSHRPDRILDWRKSIYTFSVVDKFMVICKHGGYNETTHFPSRKEVILAAIDAALDYLKTKEG